MTATATTREIEAERVNPYAGPRSLRREDGIYGRNREIRELRASLLAHRIVLLYSQSGAGKTSLIEAGLRPEFEKRGFQVFPTIRVGYEAPPDAGAVNRYLFSTLASLEEGQTPGDQLDPAELATTSLDEYVRRCDELIPDSDPLLFFDQFEELFTLDPTDWDEKREFLREIGRTLEDRGRWAMFAMREDFIAQLDPYVALIPTQLSTRFRLELLDPAGAVEAIKQPASSMGVDFTDAAAAHLVDDLRRIQVQRGDRAMLELGPSVEPVQLQVVCHRVWSDLPEDVSTIEPGDVAAAGTVNEALADFYETQVELAASRTRADERAIRTWFETKLITQDGFRTQVREGPSEDTDQVVEILQGSHLIRSDRIRGAEWYELTHDRFVEPIRASNAQFMRRRRSRRLRFGLIAGGIVLVATLLLLLGTVLFGTVASAPTLGRDAEEIALGESVSGEIESPGGTRVYSFEATEGDAILMTVVADSELTPEMTLLDAEEARLTSTAGDPVPGEPEVLAMIAPSSGRYLVAVTGSRGSAGPFELQVSRPEVSVLVPDAPVSGSIAEPGEVMIHHIEDVAAGDSLAVRLGLQNGLGAATFELFAPNGEILSSGEAFGEVPVESVLQAEFDGTYVVSVQASGGATGSYEIEQLATHPATFGQVASEEIAQSGDIKVFRFDAVAGDIALVTAIARDSLSPTINLYGPDGTWVSSAVGFFDELGEPFYLAAPTSTTGAYHLVVGGFDGSIGEFELTLERPPAEDLTVDQPVEGAVVAMSSVGVHRLSATAGDTIVVRIATEPGLTNARFELFGPGGSFLTSGTSLEGEPGVITLEASEDGDYLVTVGSRYGSTGEYVIERVVASSLGFDQVHEGSVGSGGDIAPFSFSANSGETVLITVVAPEGGLNPVVTLFDPLGVHVSTAVGLFDQPGEPWILTAPIATTGVYQVTVAGSPDDQGGPFELTVERPEVTNLPLGATVENSLDEPLAVGVHRLNAYAGDSVALRTSPDPDLGTAAVSVVGPDGALVTSANFSADGTAAPMIFEAPTDGSYLVTVTGTGGATGAYEVSRIGVRRLNVDQTIEDVGDGSGETFVYSFDAVEGEIPLISLVAADDPQPEVSLYDPDGFWVSSGTGFEEAGEPWILPAPITTGGVHHVTVSADGPLEITLTRPPIEYLEGDPVTATITEETPVGMHVVQAAAGERLVVQVSPDSSFAGPVFEVFSPQGWFLTSGSTIGGTPGEMTFDATEEGGYLITVHGYQGSLGTYSVATAGFESNWNAASLVPDHLVEAQPADYVQESGGSSGNCLEWDDTGLLEEDSMLLSPQPPLSVDHSVWAWAATFESGDGVDSYLDSFGEGCAHPANPTVHIYPPTELEDGIQWYVTTQQRADGSAELLHSVGVLGRTDTGVVEVALLLTDVAGSRFIREIEIDPDDPYTNSEARELALGMTDALQERLDAMSAP